MVVAAATWQAHAACVCSACIYSSAGCWAGIACGGRAISCCATSRQHVWACREHHDRHVAPAQAAHAISTDGSAHIHQQSSQVGWENRKSPCWSAGGISVDCARGGARYTNKRIRSSCASHYVSLDLGSCASHYVSLDLSSCASHYASLDPGSCASKNAR